MLKGQLADKAKEMIILESKLKHEEKMRQDAERELETKRQCVDVGGYILECRIQCS